MAYGSNPWDNSSTILQNRSGEFLAQGIQGGQNAFMQGVLQYEANKQMSAMATAKFEGAVKANPDILQILQSEGAPKDVAAAFKKLQAGGAVGMKDAAVLGAFSESYTEQKRRAQEMQAQQQAMEQNAFVQRQQQQNISALRGAFAPQSGGPVSAQQALRGYLQQGGVPDSATSQMFNAALDSEAMQQQMEAQRNAPRPIKLEKIEQGDNIVTIDANTGQVVATAPRTAIPSGYGRDATTGGLVALPGSKPATDAAATEAAKQNKLRAETDRANVIIGTIDRILPAIDSTTAGAVGAVAGMIPGTDAYDIGADLDTIRANIGFAELQAMRDASPTGGALGQVAIQEINYLQSALGNLDRKQSPAKLRRTLARIRNHFDRWKMAVSGVNPDEDEAKPDVSLPTGWSIRD